jgi:homeobox-leucine zipper protein
MLFFLIFQLQPTSTNQNSMLILQETCTDESGAMVVYAPVDLPAMQLVMGGGDSTYVALLPSGFAILPGGPDLGDTTSGSLLTVAFQILVNSLIACTVKKIKAALHCDVKT